MCCGVWKSKGDFQKKNHIFIKRDVYYNQHLNLVEHHYLLYIIHHPVLNWEKKVSSVVNKCKSQRLFFFIWAFKWGVLCSPNHNSQNFYRIPKGQPKIPHFYPRIDLNKRFLPWPNTTGVTKFKEKLDCRMDVVFFSNLIDMFESYSIHITLEIVSRLKNCSSRTIFFFWLKPNWMILISFLIDFMIRHLTYSCGQKSFIQSF